LASTAETWHYGVVARWWALFNTDGPEIAYFQRFLEDDGERRSISATSWS
jgi:hypothetical protein